MDQVNHSSQNSISESSIHTHTHIEHTIDIEQWKDENCNEEEKTYIRYKRTMKTVKSKENIFERLRLYEINKPLVYKFNVNISYLKWKH